MVMRRPTPCGSFIPARARSASAKNGATIGREGRHSPHAHVDVQRDQLLRGDAVAAFRVEHLVEIVHAFGVGAEQVGDDAHALADA